MKVLHVRCKRPMQGPASGNPGSPPASSDFDHKDYDLSWHESGIFVSSRLKQAVFHLFVPFGNTDHVRVDSLPVEAEFTESVPKITKQPDPRRVA